MKSIGIYPGTFDPIHEGHIAFAETTLSQCDLDIIYFAPEKLPRGKTNVTDISKRILTMDAALTKRSSLDLIRLESDRFTVQKTLPEIEIQLGLATFTLLLGSDVAKGLEDWPGCEVLLSKWNIAVGMRNNDSVENIEAMFRRIEEKYGISVFRTFIHTDRSDLSSSDFRQQFPDTK